MRNFIIAILLLVSPCLYAQNQPTFEQAWQAAQNGDANAYYWLGCFYYQGEGTKQNYVLCDARGLVSGLFCVRICRNI